MSETVRSYSAARLRPRRSRSSRRRGRKLLFAVLAVAVLVLLVLWFTRDTTPLRNVIPAGQTYGVVLVDILNNRSTMADSAVWSALPDSWSHGDISSILGREMPVPDWILNNLIGDPCYVTGNDLDEFSDVLFITKMFRAGPLIERFLPGIESDYAGGLRLRSVPSAGFFYAVRGRLLIVSPSRDALIRSLTLTEENMIPETVLANALGASGTEQVRGLVTLRPEDPLGDLFRSLSFALRIDPAGARLKCRGILCETWQDRFGVLLGKAKPEPLPSPPSGMVGMSVDLGVSVLEVCEGLRDALAFGESWTTWHDGLEPDDQANLAALGDLLALTGPAFQVVCTGVDPNEMLPVPEFVCIGDVDSEAATALFSALPSPKAVGAWVSCPRFDPETGRVSVPMMGGPSIEPTILLRDKRLVISTNATAELLQSPAFSSPSLSPPGNLYLRLDPKECLERWAAIGAQLASQGALRGYTSEAFAEAMASWRTKAAVVEEVSGILAVEPDAIALEATLLCYGNSKDG